MEIKDVDHRVARLERQVRNLKWVAAALALLPGTAIALAYFFPRPISIDEPINLLKVRELLVVNEQGVPLVDLGQNELGHGYVTVQDSEGKNTAGINTGRDGGQMYVMSPDKKGQAWMAIQGDQDSRGGYWMSKSNGQSVLRMGALDPDLTAIMINGNAYGQQQSVYLDGEANTLTGSLDLRVHNTDRASNLNDSSSIHLIPGRGSGGPGILFKDGNIHGEFHSILYENPALEQHRRNNGSYRSGSSSATQATDTTKSQEP